MVATPGNMIISLEFQDNRGFRAITTLRGFDSDLTADTNTNAQILGHVNLVAAAVAAASNTKLIKVAYGFDYDYAQEPTSETGTYQLVTQKARLQGGDGNGGFMSMSIPGPKDGLFLTAGDNNLIVVNPAAALLTAIQTAIATPLGSYPTPRGGVPFSQFFGGQFVNAPPKVRRVLQGA